MNNDDEEQFLEVTASTFSAEVIEMSHEHEHMTLLESIVQICAKYDVPFECVCAFETERTVARGSLMSNDISKIVIKDTVNLITTNLYDKLHAECTKNGLIKGRVGTLI